MAQDAAGSETAPATAEDVSEQQGPSVAAETILDGTSEQISGAAAGSGDSSGAGTSSSGPLPLAEAEEQQQNAQVASEAAESKAEGASGAAEQLDPEQPASASPADAMQKPEQPSTSLEGDVQAAAAPAQQANPAEASAGVTAMTSAADATDAVTADTEQAAVGDTPDTEQSSQAADAAAADSQSGGVMQPADSQQKQQVSTDGTADGTPAAVVQDAGAQLGSAGGEQQSSHQGTDDAQHPASPPAVGGDVPEAAAETEPDQGQPTAAPAPAAAKAAPAAAPAFSPQIDQDEGHNRQPHKAYFKDGVRAIDVEVDCGPGIPCKLLHVIVDVSALEAPNKPYLGGFKHKQQGTIYHHASIQTPQDQSQGKKGRRPQAAAASGQAHEQQQQQDSSEVGVKLTRQTQTVKETSCSSQTVREAATQMARSDLLVDCSKDRVLTPRPYVTAAVVEQRREAAALTIQRFTRGWFARKRAGVMRDIKAEREAFLAETAAESAQAAYDHKRREVERRTHPLSKADFVLLESELESWRQQQTAAIKNAGLVQQEEQAALQLLLAKETRLLHTLDKLRVAAHQEKRTTGRQKVLGELAQPKTWSLSNGKKVLVHTPLTVRAAELQQLYRGLTLPSLTLDERLDVLLHVKWVAKEWDTNVTRELVELIDREADLLNRGRSPKTLDGLRRRIAGLFLTCCQNPAFNPEAARLRVNAVGPNGPEAFEYVLEQQAVA